MSDDESEYSLPGEYSDDEDNVIERGGKTQKTPTFTIKKDKQNIKILHNVK